MGYRKTRASGVFHDDILRRTGDERPGINRLRRSNDMRRLRERRYRVPVAALPSATRGLIT